MADFYERKMKVEISSVIFTWRGYQRTQNPKTRDNLKLKVEGLRSRYQKHLELFEHHYARMQYEKGVKISFE